MLQCQHCREEIDDESFRAGECPKCGQEFTYGLQGCGG